MLKNDIVIYNDIHFHNDNMKQKWFLVEDTHFSGNVLDLQDLINKKVYTFFSGHMFISITKFKSL